MFSVHMSNILQIKGLSTSQDIPLMDGHWFLENLDARFSLPYCLVLPPFSMELHLEATRAAVLSLLYLHSSWSETSIRLSDISMEKSGQSRDHLAMSHIVVDSCTGFY